MNDEVISLNEIDEGTWYVYTETSRYTIDLDNKKAMREPGKGLGYAPGHESNPNLSPLRHDGRWFDFLLITCEVGPGMTLICNGIAQADIYTIRQTSFVRRIERKTDE